MSRGEKNLDRCPLCSKLLDDQDRALRGYESHFLIRCSGCGLVFAKRVPSKAELDETYSRYDYGRLQAERTVISAQKDRAIVEHLSTWRQLGNVLDIACGYGRYLAEFQALGFRCFGTEFDHEKRSYLASKGITVLDGGLIPSGIPDGMFDVAILTEVIEHVLEPRPILTNIASKLRTGGCLFVTTPNFDSLERRILGPRWGMVCWPEHLSYWTPATLTRAAVDCGLEPISVRTENISVFRIMQAVKKASIPGLTNVSEQRVSDLAQTAANKPGLSAVKSALDYLVGKLGLGSGIVATYRRRPSTK